MDEEKNIPLLFSFYFGDSAWAAQRGASRRLKKWSLAFEGWLGERKRVYQKDTVKQARLAWRRLVRQCGKMPWEMRREDIEQHVAWMEEEGYATGTVHDAIGILASFYQWCDQRHMDRSCEKGFNPAAEVRRPRVGRYTGALLLSREEVDRLLGILKRDTSQLGKREQAFTLARLRLGGATQ